MDNNYYQILNISYNATQEEIKKAYRSLSLKYHPDKNSNDNDKTTLFQNITQAYKVLSNIESKTKYDYSISNCFKNNSFENYNNESFNNESFNNDGYSNIFNQYKYTYDIPYNKINNNHRKTNDDININKNKSIHIIKYISYEESFIGTKLPVEITRHIFEYNEDYNETETIYIDILKGTDHNEIIIIKNKGNCYNGLYGNVKIKIKLLENPNFQRKGLDLIYLKTITFKESLCGFTFQLKHLNNKFYTINNETGIIIHNNYTTILNNLGFIKDDVYGNLIIKYNVIYPDKLCEETIDNLRKIL